MFIRKKEKRSVKVIVLLFMLLFFMILVSYVHALFAIPNELYITNGKEYVYNFKMPLSVDLITAKDKNVDLKLNGSSINDNKTELKLMSPFTIFASNDNQDKINLNLKFLGLIPLKTIQVEVVPNKMVIPCGNSIGVKIHTDGVLVVGTSSIFGADGNFHEPYQSSNIDVGDYIVEINGKKITDITTVVDIMNKSNGQPLTLKIKRNDNYLKAKITPCKVSNGKYKMGIWLRDSTAGIGTMTFYDQDSGVFGALGHGITDVDSGTLMSIKNGEVLSSNILSVKRGYKGSPGELKGMLIDNMGKGKIFANTEFGIFGLINGTKNIIPENSPMPIALRNEIQEGPAQILTNINGNSINVYNIEILKVLKDSNNTSKNLIIKITDERLLNYTGGIVQGMSGSPIIQNGKLIGAVTHVLVNDPTRGYGIFIEFMIQKARSVMNKNAA